MNPRFDYRGLKCSNFYLIPVLIFGGWIAVALLLSLTMVISPMSATALATFGVFALIGAVLFPTIGIVGGLFSLRSAKRKVLKAFDAKELPDNHCITVMTSILADRMGMPRPNVYWYDDDDINAWATGSSPTDAAIAMSKGAIERLKREEACAILGHELGHIATGDMKRMSFATGFQNALSFYAIFKGLRWQARRFIGFVSELGIKGLSRRREYWADAVGAALTSPDAMIRALDIVHDKDNTPPKSRKHHRELMFRWRGGRLLSTHPTHEQRVAELREGHFYRAVLERLNASSTRGAPQSTGDEGLYTPWDDRPGLSRWWDSLSSGAVASMALVGLLMVGTGGWYVASHSFNKQDIAIHTNANTGARVAGWTAETNLQSEPQDLTGGSEPLQGQGCITKFGKDYVTEVIRGQGPDFADVTVIKMRKSETGAPLVLGMIGGALANCWKEEGLTRAVQDMSQRAQLDYDVWWFSLGDMGDSECGVWTRPRHIDHEYGGIAAYCRMRKD